MLLGRYPALHDTNKSRGSTIFRMTVAMKKESFDMQTQENRTMMSSYTSGQDDDGVAVIFRAGDDCHAE